MDIGVVKKSRWRKASSQECFCVPDVWQGFAL